jgi:hypothetical protein
LKSGEQVIVGRKPAGLGPPPSARSARPAVPAPASPPAALPSPPPVPTLSRPKVTGSGSPVHVPVGSDGSVLVHRVRQLYCGGVN